MRHSARVLADATPENQSTCLAKVEVATVSACHRCSRRADSADNNVGGGCAMSLFTHGTRPVQLYCASSHSVVRNQQVTVEFDDDDNGWLWLVAGAYGLPLLGMVLMTLAATLMLLSGPFTTGFREFLVALAAFAGLAGGVIAWRTIQPGVVARVKKGLCLQSGRIVAVSQSFQFSGEP